MNQILSIESQKKKKSSMNGPIEIKAIIKFFAIVIMLFGIVLSSEGIYAVYRNIDDRKPANIPNVSIGRKNDKAIVKVEHNVEISTITYYWDNGEETVIPIGNKTAEEEITLLGYDSTLYIKVEDINRKQVTYQKEYNLTGQDITKPSIEVSTENGNNKMTITAKDETAISYLSYQWEGEEEVIVNRESDDQTEIKQEITLTPGTKKITIKAVDQNNNEEQIEKEIVISTSEPEMSILREKDEEIIIQAMDKDGVKDIVVNLNGKKYSARDINQKDVRVGPLQLRKGTNTISVEVTNISGYTKTGTTELEY